MAQQPLRFSVIDDEAKKRAATWKLWVDAKNEIYLACRELGGSLKASFHASGRWHFAYTQQVFENQMKENTTATDRYVDKWERPKEISPGFTLALRIVTPSNAVRTPYQKKEKKNLVEIACPSSDKAIEIYIIITTQSAGVTEWPTRRTMQTDYVGAISLRNGDAVWVVSKIIDQPDFSQEEKRLSQSSPNFFKGKGKEDLKGPGLKALALGVADDDSRILYDLAFERK